MLFFRLADGLSTSRVEPSISISIKTGLKSFLKFLRVLYFSLRSHFNFYHDPPISASRRVRLLHDDGGGLRGVPGGDELPVLTVAALVRDNVSATRAAHDQDDLLTDNVGNGQMFPVM